MATLYYVRKPSLEDETKSLRYVGIRDISDTEKINEEDIVGEDGTIIGVKNRVRAGLQHFGGHVQKVIISFAISLYKGTLFFVEIEGGRSSCCIHDQFPGGEGTIRALQTSCTDTEKSSSESRRERYTDQSGVSC